MARLRIAFAGAGATVAAATVPAAIAAVCMHIGMAVDGGMTLLVLAFAFVLAFAHAMILGLPAALVLVHKRRFRMIPMTLAGGLIGLLPSALLIFPYDGPSPDALSVYLTTIAVTCGLGAVGGGVFYLVHRAISPDQRKALQSASAVSNRRLTRHSDT